MKWRAREPLMVFARGSSLRRRVAYSLAIVRLILAPVILLAIYYLFRMGWIVDRIVNVDAPAATLAEQVSAEMSEARRAERNYLLLHDPAFLPANRQSLARVKELLGGIRDLEPDEQITVQKALDRVSSYEQRFTAAVVQVGQPGQAPVERIQAVVQAYEKQLNDLLRKARHKGRAQLLDELRSRVGSFDAQIAKTIQTGDPALQLATEDLQASGQEVLDLSSDLEQRNWRRVQKDHQEARRLLRRAEWVLGIVSGFTILLSVWFSVILPREVVKPLISLREAVDHAAAGNYRIDFDIQGEGEVVQLANSVRSLIAHVREKV